MYPAALMRISGCEIIYCGTTMSCPPLSLSIEIFR
uniref:Uncharacterized protein n=1 Tax=Siphoviridae sp. ctquf9 TaxID=2826470 RepID=A0A8S5M4I0_9CAUD|nr:MAG TPA: hypothetical protein [Siphoviridae sp. ctquf9]